MVYVYLALAIVAEVVATSALKASSEFTRFWPSVLVVVGYALAFYTLSLVLRTLPVGIAYAFWAGLGIVLIALVLMAGLRERLDLANVPELVRGTALALVLAGLLSIAFMGFGGMGS